MVGRIYHLSLQRVPSPQEIRIWVDQVASGRMSAAGVVEAIDGSDEAEQIRSRAMLVPSVPDGQFVKFCFENILDRGPLLNELVDWEHRLARGHFTRSQLALLLFGQLATEKLDPESEALDHDPTFIPWLGMDRHLNIREWQGKALAVGNDYKPVEPRIYEALRFDRTPRILVSAIASLYRGGEYIEQFLENITSQTIFRTHCELIIVDADSPENEAAVIERYMARFPNIVYHRAATRITIYEAWNVGVELAKGKYITNTNLDDLRRFDSFERQVEILEKFPFVDVAYQEFYYSFDGDAPVDKTAAVGVTSFVPIVTPYNLMQSNSPHNAPMWRRALHDEIGMFDVAYRSAGDYDFWLRCVIEDKVFYKINDPHVVYFVNPEGLSTQPNTRGIVEARRVTKQHGSRLLSRWLLCADEEFLGELQRLCGCPIELEPEEREAIHWRYTAAQRALRAYSVRARAQAAH